MVSNESLSGQSLLDLLRTKSHVDIDSLDSKAAKSLGPFKDSTSNQAIAFAELSLKHRHGILQNAAVIATRERAKYPEVTLRQLAVDVAMVLLSLEMRPSLSGRVHIQANPFYAYDVDRTVAAGKRFLALASSLDTFSAKDLSVKIASTWEGLMACRELENAGINTLATTLFTKEQAVLAAEVGCTYIAPYVNELKVHFEPGYVDPAPNLQLCVDIQQYYKQQSYKTKVLPASLTSPKEVMLLAGANHITVPPALLQALSELPANVDSGKDYASLYEKTTQLPKDNQSTMATNAAGVNTDGTSQAFVGNVPAQKLSYINNEASFRLAMTRADAGRQEKKLVDAVSIFCDKQLQLEELLAPFLPDVDDNHTPITSESPAYWAPSKIHKAFDRRRTSRSDSHTQTPPHDLDSNADDQDEASGLGRMWHMLHRPGHDEDKEYPSAHSSRRASIRDFAAEVEDRFGGAVLRLFGEDRSTTHNDGNVGPKETTAIGKQRRASVEGTDTARYAGSVASDSWFRNVQRAPTSPSIMTGSSRKSFGESKYFPGRISSAHGPTRDTGNIVGPGRKFWEEEYGLGKKWEWDEERQVSIDWDAVRKEKAKQNYKAAMEQGKVEKQG